MSKREKMLALAIGGAVVLLVNVVLIKFFIDKYRESSLAMAQAEAKTRKLEALEGERDKWAKRDGWLNANLTPLGDKDVVNKNQKEYLQGLAQKHEVLLESFAPGIPLAQPAYTALGVRIEVKGKWDHLRKFLNELQKPEKFTVLENMELKVDPNDKTQLRVTMMVSKWFLPKS